MRDIFLIHNSSFSDKPFIFTNVRTGEGVQDVINWIKRDVLLEDIK